MTDQIRPHERIAIDSMELKGIPISFSAEHEGQWYLPASSQQADSVCLLIHFHGDGRVAQQAIEQQEIPWVLLSCHWGGGSSSYQRPIQAMGAKAFLDSVLFWAQDQLPDKTLRGLYLSSWSAGYGAVRTLLEEAEVAAHISGILLMDGLHTSYVPERTVLAAGGKLDSLQMEPFVQWAERAFQGEKRFFLTHSSVFPGTFSSTTETADYLLNWVSLRRRPQIGEGPMGMQQTSIASNEGLQVISFAGNSAPDHVDHYHGMRGFLQQVGAQNFKGKSPKK